MVITIRIRHLGGHVEEALELALGPLRLHRHQPVLGVLGSVLPAVAAVVVVVVSRYGACGKAGAGAASPGQSEEAREWYIKAAKNGQRDAQTIGMFRLSSLDENLELDEERGTTV